jgi:hypothetical protein
LNRVEPERLAGVMIGRCGSSSCPQLLVTRNLESRFLDRVEPEHLAGVMMGRCGRSSWGQRFCNFWPGRHFDENPDESCRNGFPGDSFRIPAVFRPRERSGHGLKGGLFHGYAGPDADFA